MRGNRNAMVSPRILLVLYRYCFLKQKKKKRKRKRKRKTYMFYPSFKNNNNNIHIELGERNSSISWKKGIISQYINHVLVNTFRWIP
jgi:transposase